jgi:hypothetical protein
MRQYALRRMPSYPIIIVTVSLLTFFALRAPFAEDPKIVFRR